MERKKRIDKDKSSSKKSKTKSQKKIDTNQNKRKSSKSKNKDAKLSQAIVQRKLKEIIGNIQVDASTLQSIRSKFRTFQQNNLKNLIQCIKGFPIPCSDFDKQFIVLKKLLFVKTDKIVQLSGHLNQIKLKQVSKKIKKIYWFFLSPLINIQKNHREVVQTVHKYINHMGFQNLFQKIFQAEDESLSKLFFQFSTQMKEVVKNYLLSLFACNDGVELLKMRIKIILNQLKKKKKKLHKEWKPHNFDEINFLIDDEKLLNLQILEEKQFIYILPKSINIVSYDNQVYQEIDASGNDNNCLLNTLFGDFNIKQNKLVAKDPQGLRQSLKKLLWDFILKIKQFDKQEFEKFQKSYMQFTLFTKCSQFIQQKSLEKDQIIKNMLDMICVDLKQKNDVDADSIYFLAGLKNENIRLIYMPDEEIKVYHGLEENQISEKMTIIKWKGNKDGSGGHFTRLIKLDIRSERFENWMFQKLKKHRQIKDKQQLSLFLQILQKNLQSQKNYQKAFIISYLYWSNRKKPHNLRNIEQMKREFSTKFQIKFELNESDLKQVQNITFKRVGKVIVVRECGNLQTDLLKVTKWDYDENKANIRRIWLSPQGFEEIIKGTKLPEKGDNLKLTLSTWKRIYQKVLRSKDNQIIVFENFETISDSQRDQLAQMLGNIIQQCSQINNQSQYCFEKNVLIVIRVWNVSVLEYWSLSPYIHIYSMKNQSSILNKLQPDNHGDVRFQKKDEQYILNLGKDGYGCEIVLSNQFIKILDSKILEQSIKYQNKQSLSQEQQQSRSKNTLKLLYTVGFVATPETIRILAKCHQTVTKNRIFLVLQGPTGVGKTYVPQIYAKLVYSQTGYIKVPPSRLANISFHRSKNQYQLYGNYEITGNTISWKGDTVFKSVVEAGGVIMLSELNTVVKNNQCVLAWWLRQIEHAQIDENGDRTIELQSVSTHEQYLYRMKIKKGTLIVVDVNSTDYLGRGQLPINFASQNRLFVKSLITLGKNQKDETQNQKSQLQILSMYIKIFLKDIDEKKLPINIEQIGRIFRKIVIAYQMKKFGQLTQEQQKQNKDRRWKFSVRQIQRIIEDLLEECAQQTISKQKLYHILFQHFALRWPNHHDRIQISKIIVNELKLKLQQNFKYQIKTQEFLKRNLFNQRRVVLWKMGPSEISVKRQLELLKCFSQVTIQCYEMSFQVGEWQLLGGHVPDPNNLSNVKFFEGVLTNWLKENQKSQKKHLLVFENIDKMDIGAVSLLNNYLQNIKTGTVSCNGKQYKTPKHGMILLVARQEVNWSPAENSRPIYFRVELQKNQKQMKIEQKKKQEMGQMYEEDYYREVLETVFNSIMGQVKDKNGDEKMLLNIVSIICQQLRKSKKKLDESIEKVNKLELEKNQLDKLGDSKEDNKKKQQLQQIKKQIPQIQDAIKKMEEQKKGYEKQQEDQYDNQIQKKIEDLKDNIKIQTLKKQKKEQQKKKLLKAINQFKKANSNQQVKQKRNIYDHNLKQLRKYMDQQKKSIQNTLKQNYLICLNQLIQIQDLKQNPFIYKKEQTQKFFSMEFNRKLYQTQYKQKPIPEKLKEMKITKSLAKIMQLALYSLSKNKTIYFEGQPGVGKTKMCLYFGKLMNLDVEIFQMSSGVELSDLIGGLQLTYKNENQKIIKVNRQYKLLQMIQNGGIFVLDEAAMSLQAKQVISWFSQLAQKKPGDMLQIRDIPGHKKSIKINKLFHLIINGNDPKKTIDRRVLPRQVLDFSEKIIYLDSTELDEYIKVAGAMIEKITMKKNDYIQKEIAQFHWKLKQDFKKINWSKRQMQKVIYIMKESINNEDQITKMKKLFLKAVFMVYFAGLSKIQRIPYEIKHKQYFSHSITFQQIITLQSHNCRPVLVKYQPNQKRGIIKAILKKFPKLQIWKALSCFSEENLIGGLAPTPNGKIEFQLSGIGSYLVEQNCQPPPKQVLFVDIHLIKEGVRTKLNQLFQDGCTTINKNKYFWPKNLRMFFLVPIEKIDKLSDPYLSRHYICRYTQPLKNNNNIKVIKSKEIPQIIKTKHSSNNKVRILNFYSKQHEKKLELKNFQKENRKESLKLHISQDNQEYDWMVQTVKQNSKFKLEYIGLLGGIKQKKKYFQITNFHRNIYMVEILQIFLLQCLTQVKKINLMIPGFMPLDFEELTIIIDSQQRIDGVIPLIKQWQQVEYYKVEKNQNTYKYQAWFKQRQMKKKKTKQQLDKRISDYLNTFSQESSKNPYNKKEDVWLEEDYQKIQNHAQQNQQNVKRVSVQNNQVSDKQLQIKHKVQNNAVSETTINLLTNPKIQEKKAHSPVLPNEIADKKIQGQKESGQNSSIKDHIKSKDQTEHGALQKITKLFANLINNKNTQNKEAELHHMASEGIETKMQVKNKTQLNLQKEQQPKKIVHSQINPFNQSPQQKNIINLLEKKISFKQNITESDIVNIEKDNQIVCKQVVQKQIQYQGLQHFNQVQKNSIYEFQNSFNLKQLFNFVLNTNKKNPQQQQQQCSKKPKKKILIPLVKRKQKDVYKKIWETKNFIFCSKNNLQMYRICKVVYDLQNNKLFVEESEKVKRLDFIFSDQQPSFQNHQKKSNILDISKAISLNKQLEYLKLDLKRCRQLDSYDYKNISEILKSLSGIHSFQSLLLHFEKIESLNLVTYHLIEKIEQLKQLQRLQFVLRDSIISQQFIKKFSSIFEKLLKLQSLSLDFRFCKFSKDDFMTIIGILNKLKLKRLQLIFAYCRVELQDLCIKKLAEQLQKLQKLEYIYINFEFCKQVTDVAPLCQSIEKLNLVKTVFLNFKNCNIKNDESLRLNQKYRNEQVVEKDTIKYQSFMLNKQEFRRLIELHQYYHYSNINGQKSQRINYYEIRKEIKSIEQIFMSEQLFIDQFNYCLKRNKKQVLLLSEKQHYLRYNNKEYTLFQLIQRQKQIILEENDDYINIFLKLAQKKIIQSSHVKAFLLKLAENHCKLTKNTSIQKWTDQNCMQFLKLFNFSFDITEDYWWQLGDVNSIILKLVIKDRKAKLQQFKLLNIMEDLLYPICQKLDFFIKNKSILSKYQWMKYISGEKRENIFCKSGGNFSVKRYLQGKKTCYVRSGHCEGDQLFEKKIEDYYNKFLEAKKKQQVEELLKNQPRLIFVLHEQALSWLIQIKNQNCKNALLQKQCRSIISKLKSQLQIKIYEQGIIN